MNKYIFLTIMLLVTSSLRMRAQNNDSIQNKRKSVGIETGYYRAGLLDKTMSPILFIGKGTNVSIGYKSQTNKSINQFKLQFSYLPLYPQDKTIVNEFDYIKHNETEKYEAYPLTSINGVISYEYLRDINLSNSKMELFVGGVWYNYIQVMYPYSWILSYTLGPKGRLQYSFNKKHTMTTFFQFPLISISERPPYATYNNDVMYGSILSRFYSGKLMWPNSFFYSNLSLEYQYNISKKLNWSINYSFNYYKCKKNREYTSIINVLNMGMTYKFN